MKQMDYEQEIKALEAGIARIQGQIDLLRMLQQAGAVVQLPTDSPQGMQDTSAGASPEQ